MDRRATDELRRLNPYGLLSHVHWGVMEVSFLDAYAAHTHRPGLGIPSPSLYSLALTVAVHVI